jgi:ABC-type sugar transport system permease subunit
MSSAKDGFFGVTPIGQVLSLRSNHGKPLETWNEIIWHIFVWVLFSSLMVHVCAVATSVCFLYKHKYARFYFILLLLNCVLVPFTVGLISSGAIAGVYHIVNWKMDTWMALLWGIGQTLMLLIVSMCRLSCTL